MGRIFHWQNLNDGPKYKKPRHWLYGRCWWHFSKKHYESCWHAEWNVWRSGLGCGISFSDPDRESGITVHLSCGLFGVYFGYTPKYDSWLNKLPFMGRELGISWHDDAFQIRFFPKTFETSFSKNKPIFRTYFLKPWDILFGRQKYSKEEIESKDVIIPMPEGGYPAKITMVKRQWKRPRWFFPKTFFSAEIELERSIPHEGKGGNSWDCGETGTSSFYCPAESYEEAIGKLVASVLKDRRRYGGSYNHRKMPVVHSPHVPERLPRQDDGLEGTNSVPTRVY